jgi:hypothetical protein
MQLNRTAQLHRHVILITSNTPNRHTRAKIRIADACHDHARPIATRITLNTGSAKTSHTAAYRMARDPLMPLTDVQWVLGHAHLSTTQIYVAPAPDDVVQSVLAHHRRQQDGQAAPPPAPAAGYRPETLDVLFGRQP